MRASIVLILLDDFRCFAEKYYFRLSVDAVIVGAALRGRPFFANNILGTRAAKEGRPYKNTRWLLRNESHFFSDLNGLSASLGAELVEETARMSLDCVLADEEFVGNLAVAHPLRD